MVFEGTLIPPNIKTKDSGVHSLFDPYDASYHPISYLFIGFTTAR